MEKEFGCEHKSLKDCLKDEAGSMHSIGYFERKLGANDVRTAVIEISEDTEMVLFSVIRSVCSRLGIDPKAFGLDLG